MTPSTPAVTEASGPILVAGATGFLGLGIVRAIAASGGIALGLVRDPARAELVRAAGGFPIVGDVLDPASLVRAATGVRAIIHVAANPGHDGSDAAESRRVRVEGGRNLIEAALEAGVPRFVVGSGYWVYASSPGPIDEDSAVEPRGESSWNYEAEEVGLAANTPGRLEVMVVRPGMIYGDGAWFAGIVDALRSGSYRIIGEGRNHWSFASVDDSGAGFHAVALRGKPGMRYNLSDGLPVTWGEFIGHVCRSLGCPPAPTIDAAEAESIYGRDIARHLAADRPMRSEKLRGLGWTPRLADCRPAISALVRAMAR